VKQMLAAWSHHLGRVTVGGGSDANVRRRGFESPNFVGAVSCMRNDFTYLASSTEFHRGRLCRRWPARYAVGLASVKARGSAKHLTLKQAAGYAA
jgi:hypothetical protein